LFFSYRWTLCILKYSQDCRITDKLIISIPAIGPTYLLISMVERVSLQGRETSNRDVGHVYLVSGLGIRGASLPSLLQNSILWWAQAEIIHWR
jgi:hypothetical protein